MFNVEKEQFSFGISKSNSKRLHYNNRNHRQSHQRKQQRPAIKIFWIFMFVPKFNEPVCEHWDFAGCDRSF